MGNQTSLNNSQTAKYLKDYKQIAKIQQGTIYSKIVKDPQTNEQFQQHYILKELNYPNEQTYLQNYQKYLKQIQKNNNKTSQSLSNTLAVRQVLKQQIKHFCSNTYRIYTLYEYPQLNLQNQIQVRRQMNKYFQQQQLIAILQTCILSLQQIKSIICFNTKSIYILPNGVIKILHNDLIDQNYRHIMIENVYYSPEKFTNFYNQNYSQNSLKKQIIFSIGMTILQTSLLQSCYGIYNYQHKIINQKLLIEKIDQLNNKYSPQLIELLTNMLEINPNRRISLLEIQRALNRYDQIQQQTLPNEEEKQQMEKKCQELFQKSNQKCSKITLCAQEPNIPNLLSQQNSSRVSLSMNQNSNNYILNNNFMNEQQVSYKVSHNYRNSYTAGQQYKNAINNFNLAYQNQQRRIKQQKQMQDRKNLPQISKNYIPHDLSQMTSKISKTTQNINQITQSVPYQNNNLFTDPRLLEMIRKDLEQISKTRTSRIIMNTYRNNQQMNMNHVVGYNDQNMLNNTQTKRFEDIVMQQRQQHENNVNNSQMMNNSQIMNKTQNYMNCSYNQNNENNYNEHYKILKNCPQVESLNASIARQYQSSHKTYIYQESQVKNKPQDFSMKNSAILESNNFNQMILNNQSKKLFEEQNIHNQMNQQRNQMNQQRQQINRIPLKQVNKNQLHNQKKGFLEIEQELKKDMMKKKQNNLVYLQEIYEDGVKYQGMSKNGLKQGYGKLIYNDGAYYQGYFHDDRINGKGTLFYNQSHPAYDGQWKQQQFNGFGILYNQEPQQLDQQFPYHNFNFLENYWLRYQGQFLNDNKHGFGKIFLTSLQFIQAEFKDDMLSGQGRFIRRDGTIIQGKWENNILVQINES